MPINITSLSKEFQSSKKVLADVTTELPSNDISVIIGKNGSGKSTLLNCIGGLLTFENGKIQIDIPQAMNFNLESGNRIIIPKDSRIKIGHIFQQKVLWNHLSIIDNIVHPLTKVHRVPKEQAVERAKQYLNLLKVEESLYKKYPSQLSGGQQRKVAIARTLSMEPELLLIDELEANLDQSSLKLTMEIIKEKYIDTRKTVLIISHSIDMLEQFVPHIIVLNEGEVIESAKGAKELLIKEYDSTPKYNRAAKIKIIKDSVDSSSSRWFLANQSLETAIKISEINLAERDINKLFNLIGKEISKLISRFEPEREHLLLIATKSKDTGTTKAEVKIRCAEKSDGFLLNGNEVKKLNGLVEEKSLDQGQTVYQFVQSHWDLFQNKSGFNLEKKSSPDTSAHDSLIDLMFDKNGELTEFQYTERHPIIKGAYNIAIPIPNDNKHQTERMSYYEFSKNTRNVYLIGCKIDKEVKGIISIDTCAENKWSDFIIQQLILIGNMVAIAIKNHE